MRRVGKEVLQGYINKQGYHTVSLSRSGKSTSTKTHRIVAEAFHGTAPPGTECCHKNDIKQDNRANNLYWGTRSDNLRDRVKNGLDHNSVKTHCPNGHRLQDPNIYWFVHKTKNIKGRGCKACNLGRSRARQQGRPFELQDAQEFYTRIMEVGNE